MKNIFVEEINPDELGMDFKRISNVIKEKGILEEEKTKKQFFTGYEYKTLYDWDQYFEAIIQLYLGWGCKYIKNGITLFLDFQQEDGFVARTVPLQPDEREGSEHAKPFLAQITLLVYKREHDLSWLGDKYYEKLKKFLIYWLTVKDKDGNCLSTWDSAPHSGMDNQHERAGWWKDCFCEGVDLNSYLYRECKALSIVAGAMGKEKDAGYFLQRAEMIKDAIQNTLWNEKDGFYYDRNEKNGEIIKVKSVGCFAPLWAGIATPEQAQRLVSEHILNPDEFWRPFPLPAYAANEEGYYEESKASDLGCCWKANAWVPTNYYIFQGLRRYGYKEIAGELAYKTYSMVKRIGDREYYTSESISGCGLNPFWGWSLLAYFMPVEYTLDYDPTRLETSISDIAKVICC